MEHIKNYNIMEHSTSKGPIIIEGPLSSIELKNYQFHEDLTTFRPAYKQFDSLQRIADFPEGRIIIARTTETIIGYVTILYPDPMERWSEFQMKDLMELGAVEVIPEYRGEKIATNLIKFSMHGDTMENFIIISTEYYWHWDLDGTNLSVWKYRKMMERMMKTGGLEPAPTDDPEIISHPANCLMVRIGKNVPEESIKQFDELRFLTKNRNKRPTEEGF